MKAIFKDGSFPPYHDFDSGDCYLLLAQAYLATGNDDKAMYNVEKSVMYYLDLFKDFEYDRFDRRKLMQTSLLKETQQTIYIEKAILKEKLIKKLSAPEIEQLRENERYKALYEKVYSL